MTKDYEHKLGDYEKLEDDVMKIYKNKKQHNGIIEKSRSCKSGSNLKLNLKVDYQTDEKSNLIPNASSSVQYVEKSSDNPLKQSSNIKLDLSILLENYNHSSIHEAMSSHLMEHHETSYPKPFLNELYGTNWHEKSVLEKTHNLNFRIRVFRASCIIIIPCIILIITSIYKFAMSLVVGVCLLMMFTIYFAIVLRYIFMKNKDNKDPIKLYRLYSVCAKPKDWINLDTGYVQLKYDEESIQSISELSAVNGGVTKTMLNTLGAYTWCAVLVHFFGVIYYTQDVFRWHVSDICVIVGVIGLLLISLFELDPFNKQMQFMHYMGAALGCGTIAGYIIQQWYIGTEVSFIIAIIIGVIAFIGFVLWQLSGIATDMAQIESKAKYMSELKEIIEKANKNGEEPKLSIWQFFVPGCFKKKSINDYSRMNIVFEAVFLYLGSLSLCLWLINYD